eukprot:CAMPEP_0172812064 /NCGR_PEP_ID=MMETSP1075-20121228/9805_1 /TAXON_ID=2916 /ORGANISM="Ceratium fusus, Strain PA161109" /LENGTH=84 /DNA_ID=CAMNT_0013651571 /DNA_START=197 /DNA_END=452 /DNA_ORIENTATION=-
MAEPNLTGGARDPAVTRDAARGITAELKALVTQDVLAAVNAESMSSAGAAPASLLLPGHLQALTLLMLLLFEPAMVLAAPPEAA